MEAKTLTDAMVKMSVILEEVRFEVAKVREQNDKRSDRDIESLIKKMEELSIKVDTLSAADLIMPVMTAGGSRVVKIADSKSAASGTTSGTGTGVVQLAPATETKKAKTVTITEFFKTTWVENFKELKSKGLIDPESEQKDIAARGSKTAQVQLRRLATDRWRALSNEQSELVRAMKVKYESEMRQQNSTSISEEVGESKGDSKAPS